MVIKIKKVYIFITALVLICAVGLFETRSVGVSAKADDKKTPLPIVMYHQITKRSSHACRYCVTIEELENDLKHIKDSGYKTITLTMLIDAVYNGSELPEKPIIITFDDGFETSNDYLVPLLEKYDMVAVVSIIGTLADFYSEIDDHNLTYSYLNWEEITELVNGKRVEIQNHSFDLHKSSGQRRGAKKINGESIESYTEFLSEDVGKMQRLTAEHTSWTPNTFTYPFGRYSPESKEILKNLGFKAAMVCEEKINYIDTENTEWLFRLGRFNRPHNMSSYTFFSKLLK